jgi:hypothetical protein
MGKDSYQELQRKNDELLARLHNILDVFKRNYSWKSQDPECAQAGANYALIQVAKAAKIKVLAPPLPPLIIELEDL